MLKEDEKLAIDEFLAERWVEFENHCYEHSVDADEIAIKLQE